MSLSTYRARSAGWIAGKRVEAGAEIRLTAAAAKYEPVDPVIAEPAPRAARKDRAAPATRTTATTEGGAGSARPEADAP